ncbi:hypothetical protein MUP01_10080 [Candidatus Bathyarchaeota archaeon]|nr:hypothetical protein [Candidatus Bathyarchaeota archaeon]
MSSEDFEIFVEDIVDWCNSQEAGLVILCTQIQELLGETEPSLKLPFDARAR